MNNKQRKEFWKGLGAVWDGVDDDGYGIARLPCGTIVARDYAGWDWFDPEGVPLEDLLDGLEGLAHKKYDHWSGFQEDPTVAVVQYKDGYRVVIGDRQPDGDPFPCYDFWEIIPMYDMPAYPNRRTAIIAAICKLLKIGGEDVT